MKVKDIKAITADLNDEDEITGDLIITLQKFIRDLGKPDWTRGKELWAEWKNEDNESFITAWQRITKDKTLISFLRGIDELSSIDRWNDAGIQYHRMSNGFVIITFPACWSIQEDPTFGK